MTLLYVKVVSLIMVMVSRTFGRMPRYPGRRVLGLGTDAENEHAGGKGCRRWKECLGALRITPLLSWGKAQRGFEPDR